MKENDTETVSVVQYTSRTVLDYDRRPERRMEPQRLREAQKRPQAAPPGPTPGARPAETPPASGHLPAWTETRPGGEGNSWQEASEHWQQNEQRVGGDTPEPPSDAVAGGAAPLPAYGERRP